MHSLEDVIRIKSEVESDLLQLPGVTGVGVGYRKGDGPADEPVIRVYVADIRDVPDKLKIPDTIRDIPTEVIERQFILHSNEEE